LYSREYVIYWTAPGVATIQHLSLADQIYWDQFRNLSVGEDGRGASKLAGQRTLRPTQDLPDCVQTQSELSWNLPTDPVRRGRVQGRREPSEVGFT